MTTFVFIEKQDCYCFPAFQKTVWSICRAIYPLCQFVVGHNKQQQSRNVFIATSAAFVWQSVRYLDIYYIYIGLTFSSVIDEDNQQWLSQCNLFVSWLLFLCRLNCKFKVQFCFASFSHNCGSFQTDGFRIGDQCQKGFRQKVNFFFKWLQKSMQSTCWCLENVVVFAVEQRASCNSLYLLNAVCVSPLCNDRTYQRFLLFTTFFSHHDCSQYTFNHG